MDKHRLRARLLATFLDELEEHARVLEANALALEKTPGSPEPEQVNSMFRAAHSLKGAARSAGVPAVESRCHQLEETLSAVRNGLITLDNELVQLLLTTADELIRTGRELRAQHELETSSAEPTSLPSAASSRRSAPPPTAPATTKPDTSKGLVRLPAAKLDALLARSGELLIARQRATMRLEDVAALRNTLAACLAQWRQLESSWARDPERADQRRASATRDSEPNDARGAPGVTQFKHGLRQLERDLEQLEQGLATDHHLIHLAAQPLEEAVREARMAPFSEACGGLERAVRDLAKLAQKRVELHIEGSDVELDRAILSELKDPLLHLVRNAIDHGLEPAAERTQRGKPAVGRVTLGAALKGAGVEITIADDGRGLDLEAIRRQARLRDLPAPASDQELVELIYSSGFSTTQLVTELSGRGVGLDVVKHAVETLHGHVDVSSTPTRGTEFRLQLPLTLTTTRVLIVRVHDELYAIPTSAVRRLVRAGPSDVRYAEGVEVLLTEETPIALCSLAQALAVDAEPDAQVEGKLSVVVLATSGRELALVVDELLEEREVVVKNLGRRLGRVRCISGSTVLPTGKLCLILAPAELFTALARPASALFTPDSTARAQSKRLLVVDDSITTRSLEKSILENAGYRVSTAPDGARAWQLLQEQPPDLVITDVEMPRVDGFELTELIRGSKRFKELPVILVTALESEADKARGLQVGADAYLPKSTFDQQQLLETVARLVGDDS